MALTKLFAAPPPPPPVQAAPAPASTPTSKREKLTQQFREYERLLGEKRLRDREYCEYLDWLMAQRPRVLALRREQEEFESQMRVLEADMKDVVRELRETVTVGKITVTFSDPMRTEFDVDLLLCECPQAEQVPGLIRKEVNGELFPSAVAAGRIPTELASRVEKRVPTTKAGRVELKIDWRG